MTRKVVQKTSFLGGEAGPLLEGRSDLAQFLVGCSPGQNFINLKGGAAARRPGSRFVKATQGDAEARLVPYIISYDSGVDIYVVEITRASSTTLGFRVIRVSDNTVYTPSGSPINCLSTTDIHAIQYAQIGARLFLVSAGFEPFVLERTTTVPAFQITGYIGYSTTSRLSYEATPYRPPNITATTLTANNAAIGSGKTITASSAFFDAGHVGAFFQHTEAATTGYFVVTGFTNSTTVTATIIQTLGGTGGSSNWVEGAWSTYRGWPRTVTFYNQRAIFGGNESQTDTFWASQVSDYFEMGSVDASTFAFTTAVDDSKTFTLASTKLNQIRWMVGGKKLTIGTSSSEWVGQFREDGADLFIEFDEETTHGSAFIQPHKYAYTIPFVQRSRQGIREMLFDFDSDNYVATDLNLFGSHIGTPYGQFSASNNVYIQQVAFQEAPFNILWVIDSVGRLYGLTRDKQQQIASWHSHVLGGAMTELILTGGSGPDYPAFVTSICVVPDANGRKDRLWMVVRRAINGADKYHVEYIDDIKQQPYLTCGTATDVKAHLDCATVATAASTVTWAGYTRFASTNAYVIAEEASGAIVYNGLLAVSGAGVITLPIAATKICVGLHVDAYLRLLPIEGGSGPEVTLRSSKRVDLAAIKMYQTWGLRIGRNRILRKTGEETNTTFEPIPFDLTAFPTIPTFTGTKEPPVPTDADTDGSFALAMQDPWPCTILSVSSRTVFNEV